MDYYSNQISKLIDELSRLPGIGAKSASRLAFHLIHMPKEEVKRLGRHYGRGRENSTLLQRMLHPDGSGTLPKSVVI